jgi:D-alanyl-D-alanine carboxypeptidase
MNHFLRNALATAFAILALTLAQIPQAQARYAAFVMEADSGRVLYEVNADTRNYPASLTKMMTLYLLFEALEEGRVKADQPLTVSRQAARMPASKLGLKRGQSIRVDNAILALVTKSANDVAVVVAEALAGKEAEFARMMTRKAKALGMTRTSFRNASGLYNRGQLSTARDMAILAQALIRDFPARYKAFSIGSFTYNGRRYRNHNKLLRSFSGTDGLKTGYIAASGYNLAASAKRDGHRVIAVVFGGKTAGSRDRQVAKLLDRGFRLLSDPIYLATGGVLKHGISPPPAKPLVPATAQSRQQKAEMAQLRPASGGSGWGVQVGAFYSYDPAKKAAETAMARVPDLLSSARVAITHISGQRGKIYRARLFDLSEGRARKACQRLASMKSDCLVIQDPNRVKLAQSNAN